MEAQAISQDTKEGQRQIVVELPDSLVKVLKIAAVKRDTTLKAIVESALRAELREDLA